MCSLVKLAMVDGSDSSQRQLAALSRWFSAWHFLKSLHVMFTSHNQLSIPGHEFQGSFKVRTLSVNQPGIMAVSREPPFHKISLTRWVHFPLGLTANESCHFCSSWLCVYSTVQRALRRATDFIQNRRHWCQQTVAEAKQTNICRCIHMAHNVHVCHIDACM